MKPQHRCRPFVPVLIHFDGSMTHVVACQLLNSINQLFWDWPAWRFHKHFNKDKWEAEVIADHVPLVKSSIVSSQSNFVLIDDRKRSLERPGSPSTGQKRKRLRISLGKAGEWKWPRESWNLKPKIGGHQFASYEKFLARWPIIKKIHFYLVNNNNYYSQVHAMLNRQ